MICIHTCQVFKLSTRCRVIAPHHLSIIIVPNFSRLGNRPLFCRATAPTKKRHRRLRMAVWMPSQRGILRAFCVRQGGVVGSKSALEANDSHKRTYLVVSRWELGDLFRSEGPRQPLVQRGLNHLSASGTMRTFRLSGAVVCLYNSIRAESFEACPHETDPSIDFERGVSVYV